MTARCQGPDPAPRRPRLSVPAGACDSHFHIFGPVTHFAFAASRSYTPPAASIAAYGSVMTALGIARCVVVQPSVYGTDNACTRQALARLGASCRGVAVVNEAIEDEEIAALDAEGFRGVRFNLLFEGGVGLDSLEAIGHRIAAFGWHIQLLVDGRRLDRLAPRLRALPVPVVIDHMGHLPAACGVGHPGFRALLRLVADGAAWVKLSGAYRLTPAAAPYPDTAPLARALISAAPDRVVWGTDWPHPAHDGAMPNDGDLLDLIAEWTDDEDLRHKILVANPAELYGF